jgi:SAM-dependent methyltransferase
MTTYVFVSDARARLAAAEELLDPGSIALLDRLNVGDGWRCLELGAGGGSIARWLGHRVGAAGHVLATDVDTRFLDTGGLSNVEGRRHDVTADPLPDEGFDLVHARLVLEHLASRDAVLSRLQAALKPGGWMLLESVDYVSAVPVSELGAAEHAHTQATRLAYFRAQGIDDAFGRKLPGVLRSIGLSEIQSEGRAWVMQGGSPGARWFAHSLHHLRTQLVGSGVLQDAEIDRMLELFADPNWEALSPVIMAAWGRRTE